MAAEHPAAVAAQRPNAPPAVALGEAFAPWHFSRFLRYSLEHCCSECFLLTSSTIISSTATSCLSKLTSTHTFPSFSVSMFCPDTMQPSKRPTTFGGHRYLANCCWKAREIQPIGTHGLKHLVLLQSGGFWSPRNSRTRHSAWIGGLVILQRLNLTLECGCFTNIVLSANHALPKRIVSLLSGSCRFRLYMKNFSEIKGSQSPGILHSVRALHQLVIG